MIRVHFRGREQKESGEPRAQGAKSLAFCPQMAPGSEASGNGAEPTTVLQLEDKSQTELNDPCRACTFYLAKVSRSKNNLRISPLGMVESIKQVNSKLHSGRIIRKPCPSVLGDRNIPVVDPRHRYSPHGRVRPCAKRVLHKARWVEPFEASVWCLSWITNAIDLRTGKPRAAEVVISKN